jgi:hypothetical protein
MPGSTKTVKYTTYLLPTAENVIGYVAEQTVRQLRGTTTKEEAVIALPSLKQRSYSTVFTQNPWIIEETIEHTYPQPVSFFDRTITDINRTIN